MPIQSPGLATAPIQSPDPVVQQTIPMAQPFNMMSSVYPNPFSGLSMYRPASHEGLSESSSFYQTPSPYGFQTASPLVMQTPPHSLFYQGGSSSQHRQPDPLPEEPESLPEQPQPPPKARQRRNPAHNRR
ncbi:hypothetical protein Godav_022132 [Gossypium davidsonii]|uniref:Uncharacterized protein n=1 Tax=Gossypium davidsonii TaxID=34287 RepID=A0A7J8TCW5_GOSDV|nr:hypothetical protein [Gossypium davidsonii]